MDFMNIIYAVLVLGVLGIGFGVILSFASKKYHVEVDERVEKVRSCLAGANCGACGYPGCDGFAQAVVDGKAPVDGCAAGGSKTANAIAEIMGAQVEEKKPMVARVICQGECGITRERFIYDGYESCRMAGSLAGGPKTCRFACVGLGDCTKVCKFDAIKIVHGLAVIDQNKCTSCGNCVEACPRGVIQLKPQDATVLVRCRNSDSGRLAREACMKACIGCMRCEKNCKYDAIHVVDGFARIDVEKCTRCGECAKVCVSKCITII